MTSPPVVLRARARQDVEEAVAHYRDNAGAAAAIGFVDRLEAAFGHIAGNPRSGLRARDLARLTGETMTGAITLALRERLARERRRRDRDARIEELLAIGRRCAESLEPGPTATEHGDFLYDDRGLP